MPQESLQIYSGWPWGEHREQGALSLSHENDHEGKENWKALPKDSCFHSMDTFTDHLLKVNTGPGGFLTAPHPQAWLWSSPCLCLDLCDGSRGRTDPSPLATVIPEAAEGLRDVCAATPNNPLHPILHLDIDQ